MNQWRRRVVMVLLTGGALFLTGCEQRTETGQIDVWDPAGLPEFTMTDQLGRTVTKQDLRGKPWLACFIFTRCPLSCPRLTAEMEKLHKEFKGADLRFVSFSVDPEHDTPEVLKKYAKKAEADPERWKFLTTPDKGLLYSLIHKGFLVPLKEHDDPLIQPEFRIIHSDLIMYVDAEGRVRGKFYGLDDKQLADLRRFLQTPPLVRHFPLVNASLNALAGLLLVVGFVQIRRKRAKAHKRTMLAAFAVSVVFLGCYLTYHAYAGSKPFDRAEVAETATDAEKMQAKVLKTVYFSVLISHIVLAAVVPVLAIVTIVQGFRAERTGNWPLHRKFAWVTFPIWLYVSATGVLIYLMLYRPETLGL